MLQIRFYSQIISLTNNTYAQRGKLHTLSSTYIRALLPNLAVGLHLGRWSLIVCIHGVHACLSPLFHGGGADSHQRAAAATAVTAGTYLGSRAKVRPCRCRRAGATVAGRRRCWGCRQSSHRPSLDALGELKHQSYHQCAFSRKQPQIRSIILCNNCTKATWLGN